MCWTCHVSQKTKRLFYFRQYIGECRHFRVHQYWSYTKVYEGKLRLVQKDIKLFNMNANLHTVVDYYHNKNTYMYIFFIYMGIVRALRHDFIYI